MLIEAKAVNDYGMTFDQERISWCAIVLGILTCTEKIARSARKQRDGSFLNGRMHWTTLYSPVHYVQRPERAGERASYKAEA